MIVFEVIGMLSIIAFALPSLVKVIAIIANEVRDAFLYFDSLKNKHDDVDPK